MKHFNFFYIHKIILNACNNACIEYYTMRAIMRACVHFCVHPDQLKKKNMVFITNGNKWGESL